RAARPGDTVRGHIAEKPGEVFLRVPAQVAGKRAHLGGEPGIPVDLERAREMLRAPAEAQERLWGQGDGERGIGAARLQRAAGEDDQAQRGKKRAAQLDGLARKRREPLARPRLGGEQTVERE